MGALGAVLVVTLIVVIFVSWGGMYRRLFALPHMGELAVAGIKLRDALRHQMEEHPKQAAYGPAEYVSKEGIAIICSVHRVPPGLVYHLSLSHKSGAMAFAAGGRFLYLVGGGLGVQEHLLAVAHTPITHGVFAMTEEDHFRAEPAFDAPSNPKEAQVLADQAGRFLEAIHTKCSLLRTEEEVLHAAGLA